MEESKDENQIKKEFIGKQVTVFKVDGFVKKGELMDVLPNLIRLRFYDGNEELVPLVQISSIRVGK
jgi:hypothetical protein